MFHIRYTIGIIKIQKDATLSLINLVPNETIFQQIKTYLKESDLKVKITYFIQIKTYKIELN